MKRNISLILIIFLITLSCYTIFAAAQGFETLTQSCVTPSSTYYDKTQTSVIKTPDTRYDGPYGYGNYKVEDKIGHYRKVLINNKEYDVEYSYTENRKDKLVEERSDCYGNYDVYIDSAGTEFAYLYNTDMLCAMIGLGAYNEIPKENAISEETAIDNASDFMSNVIGNFEDYDYQECYYVEYAGEYSVVFNKKLSGIKTDDDIYVDVNAEGEIVSFTMFNRDRYDKFKDVVIDMDKNEAKAAKQIEDIIKNTINDKIEVEDGYISLGDNGQLVYVREAIFTCYYSDVESTSFGHLIFTEID